MNRSNLSLACVVLAASLSAFSQNRAASPTTASIHGTVIDAKTSQPINGAAVALESLQPGGGWNSATTLPDGAFCFTGLAAGHYRLNASRTGYASPAGDQRRLGPKPGSTVLVAPGEEVDDVVLKLTPTAVIAGRVANERDEPMPGVFVQSMKVSYETGRREFSDARSGFTDDQGEFRIWGLTPGQYYVRATNPRRGETGPAPREMYVPTFYPNVADPNLAQAVDLHPGEELTGINFAVTPSRTVHVKGRVLMANSAPAKGAEITLAQLNGGGLSLEAHADDVGRFDVPAVPSGSYVAFAEQAENDESAASIFGRTAVQVGDANVESVEVMLFPAVSFSGHLRIDGDRKINLTGISVSLQSDAPGAINQGNFNGRAAVQADDSFLFTRVPEGNYRLTVSGLPDGFYVRSGPEEDGVDGNVLVTHGHAATAEVRVSSGAGQVQGIAYKGADNTQPAPGVTVVLVPEGKRRNSSQYYRDAVADQSGNFQLHSIPPGEYSLFAWQTVEKNAYMDAAFLQRYEAAGKPVDVQEGSKLNLQLQLAAQN